jgi:hypothetical protein
MLKIGRKRAEGADDSENGTVYSATPKREDPQ